MIYDINGNTLESYKLDDITITASVKHSAIGTGIQSAFITPSGKVWMLTESKCYVVSNGSIVATITLDHSIGHANNCNYYNGYVYVSDWTDGTLIHVFAVNESNNTLTYTKDITIPTTHGRTEYWVFDSENQAWSLGWDYEHSTNSDYMIIGLWKKGKDGTYVCLSEMPVTDVTVVQGMCVHNNRMYIVNNTVDYKHIGLVIVDLDNGVQIQENSQTGTIQTLETEGIIPIADHQFIVVGYLGGQFLLTESEAS